LQNEINLSLSRMGSRIATAVASRNHDTRSNTTLFRLQRSKYLSVALTKTVPTALSTTVVLIDLHEDDWAYWMARLQVCSADYVVLGAATEKQGLAICRSNRSIVS
jgi:hypothetical protein